MMDTDDSKLLELLKITKNGMKLAPNQSKFMDMTNKNWNDSKSLKLKA